MKQRNWPALTWACVVALLLAFGASQLLTKRVALDTDILALLPAQDRDPMLQQAFAQMVDSAQQNVIVLVGAADWARASRAADAYRAVLAPHADLLEFAAPSADAMQQEWLSTFQKHKAALMTLQDEAALRTRDRQEWADTALAALYSPFAGPKIGTWQDDPFALFSAWVQARAQETPVRPRDGRLFVSDGTRDYVVMPLNLRLPAFSMHAQETIVPLLERARAAAIAAEPDSEVLSAGVVLHAAAAGKQASREVTTIGAGSLIGILLLMWFSFRSFKPIAYIVLLVSVGCLAAFVVCLLVFERVHLLTLVFGATLVGVALDYGIYFLCHRMHAGAEVTSPQLLRRLLPGLSLTLVSAAIGYMGLALTPFPGLRQMAVFSITGLLFAWLTVVFWFPAMIGAGTLKSMRSAADAGVFGAGAVQGVRVVRPRWPVLRADWRSGLALASLAVLIGAGWSQLKVNDDIRSLQNPAPALVAQQLKIGALLDAPAPLQFFLVRGSSAESVLQREEALQHRLERLIATGAISGYQALANWVPSSTRQQLRRQLVHDALMADGAALATVAHHTGEDAAWVRAIRARSGDAASLTLDEFLASPASAPWRHLWLGKVGDDYASVVAVRGLRLDELTALQQAGAGLDGVQWVDKVAEISSVLSRYRQSMGWTLFFAYGAVFALLSLRYRGAAWRVLAPTAVASATAIALLSLAGFQLQLFHVLALMLLLGIGVDYGVFFQEGRQSDKVPAWLAVNLSAASTLLAFGLLGLSATPALQAFGLTMLLGVALVWLLVPCFAPAASKETPCA